MWSYTTIFFLLLPLVVAMDMLFNRFPMISDDSHIVSFPECSCVDCIEDNVCGGIWTGQEVRQQHSNYAEGKKIIMVISHCLNNLDWVGNFTKDIHISETIIISKCGEEVIGAPSGALVVRLPNVGRCDHTYAYFITTIGVAKDFDIVIFMKDDRSEESMHCDGAWKSLESMIQISSSNGFACGMRPTQSKEVGSTLSAYHVTALLKSFSMSQYSNKETLYSSLTKKGDFMSEFRNLGEWVSFVGAILPDRLVQVCYGGTFIATREQVYAQDLKVWKNIEISLSRGNSIQEGHYAERVWAGLLARPLTKKWKIRALLNHSHGIANISVAYMGTLLHSTGPPEDAWKHAFINLTQLHFYWSSLL